MEIVIYGESRNPHPYLPVHYVVETKGADRLIEIFRQVLPYMPRYEHGDIIKFRVATGIDDLKETRYVVDRVINYVIHIKKKPKVKDLPPFQNQMYVILRAQPLAEGSETVVEKLTGLMDIKMSELFEKE